MDGILNKIINLDVLTTNNGIINVEFYQNNQLLEKFDTVLGLKITEKKEEEIPQEILDLVEQRKIARQEKNWAESDRLRDLITEKGCSVKDTKDGVEVSKL